MANAFLSEVIDVTTGSRAAAVDITDQCGRFLSRAGAREGLLQVFVPHATAGVAIIETGAGSDDDLLAAVDDLLPRDDRWRHRHGSAGHGRDHVLPGFIAPQTTVPVVDGSAMLGTWQSVVLIDTNIDNPRRQVRLTFLG